MARFFYNLFWPVGLLLFLPASLRKMIRRGGYRKDFGQRLGIYARENRRRGPNRTWIHAVSVGEIAIALKIARQMRELRPDLRCVLTTTTTTGHAYARANVPEWVEVFYSPLDFWPVMRRAFREFRPEKIVLVEAEVWPNMIARSRANKIPVILANARLSPRSEKRFRRFRAVVAPLFRQLALVCVADEHEATRWRNLGVEKLSIVGNVKYDLAGDVVARLPEQQLWEGKTVLLGASTHAGEEEILGRVLQNLHAEFPELRLVVVPRHVERASAIVRQLQARGLRVERRTESAAADSDCLLVDTTGELRSWLNIATIVFVGKSLGARGGQNPIEAVAAGKSVLFGPHMENFAQISAQLAKSGGAFVVRNEDELQAKTASLLRDPDARELMVERARETIAAHQGAAARTAVEIERARAGR